jgi:zinc transport system substrate-binding protein
MATTRRFQAGPQRILILALLALAGVVACQEAGEGTAEAAATDAVRVVVSVAPQADLVRRLGGARVEVTVLVPAGSEPHAWEPSPRVVASLADADLYFAIGHPGFPFETRLMASLGAERREGLPVVTLSGDRVDGFRSAAGRPLPAEDLAHGAGRAGVGDPHLWLSPRRVRGAMVRLADALVAADPTHEGEIRGRLESLLGEIDQVDRRVAAAADAVPGRTFLTYHAAWGSVAEEYGLEQVAVEHSGREPGPRQMARVVDRARSEGLTLVLVERGVSHRSAETLAEEIGGRLVEVDPLGDDWMEIMDQLIRAFEESAAP